MITATIDCLYTARTGGSTATEHVYFLHFKDEAAATAAADQLKQPGCERDCMLVITERGNTDPETGRGQVVDVLAEEDAKVLRLTFNVPEN